MALTKQQKEQVSLAVLLVVGALVWFFYFGQSRTVGGGPSRPGAYTPIDAQDYTVIFKDMQQSQSTVYKPSGRNIFIAGPAEATPAEVAQAKAAAKPAPLLPTVPVPVQPPPPVLAMKFFGYGSLPTNGPRRAFLLDGEEIHIVEEGDTVQNHIRITHIGNDRIEYEDTVTGKKNSTNLEVPPQG
jgi:hypothetical protein